MLLKSKHRVARNRLVYRFIKIYPVQLDASASKFFQRWMTGSALISLIPFSIRSRSSSQDCTRIWRRKVRVIFPNSVSTIFSQDPCVGVSTYLKRLGLVAKNARVSLEMCDEWLSRIRRTVHSSG